MKKYSVFTLLALLSIAATGKAALRSPSIENLRIAGMMMYDNDRSVENTGIYEYSATAPIQRKLLNSIQRATVGGDAIVKDGKLYSYNLSIEYGYINSAKYYVYDIATGESKSTNITYSDVALAYSHKATSAAIDPKSGTVYCSGLKYDADTKTLTSELKTWDLENNTKTTIGTMQAQLCVMSFDSEGNLYGITASSSKGSEDGGFLVKVDKTTGSLTRIGDTGIRPWFDQSGVISPYDGKLYWFSNSPAENGDANAADAVLYSVDLASAAATKIGGLPNGDEVVAAYIPTQTIADNAPSAVSNLATEFTGPALTGALSFTLPSTTYSGASLNKSAVEYNVKANTETLASGQGEAGTQATAQITVPASGLYTFRVTTSNEAGTGMEKEITVYVGYDVPSAIKEVTFSIADNTNTVSWERPSSTLNGGYMDSSHPHYRIVRQPGNVVLENDWTSTTYTEPALTGELQSTYYEITPTNGDVAGATTKSNALATGSSLALPYSQDFTDANALELYTVIDENSDDNTWYYSLKAAKYRQSYDNAADDWLILPPVKLETGKSYDFTFTGYNTQAKNNNIVDVALGTAPEAASMTEQLKSDIAYDGSTSRAPITTTVTIKPDKTDVYYIGIHLKSPAKQSTFTVDDISISAGKSTAIPAAPGNLTVAAGEKGALSATLSFSKPTTTAGGKELANAVTSFTIERDGVEIESVQATDDANYTITDSDISQAGTYTYTVAALNSDGKGEAATATVFIGRDEPKAPASATAADNYDGTATVKWQQPDAVGANGGYVDVENIVYSIYDSSDKEVKKGIKGLEATVSFDNAGEQQLESFTVSAKYADASADTKGASVETNSLIAGAAYTLPFEESWANAKTATSLWTKDAVSGKSYDATWYARADADYDGNGGGADMTGYAAGAASRWCSPKLDLSATTQPTASLFVKIPSGNMEFALQVQTEYGEWKTIARLTEAAEWTPVTVDLSPYRSKCTRLGLLGTCTADINYVYVDQLTVAETLSSVESAANDNVSIIPGVGKITISIAVPVDVNVFNTAGALVYAGNLSATDDILLNAGIYIIKAGTRIKKAIVR